ncbi:hypothetical protein ACLOJK_021821 [Asimina triloba]
MLDSSEPTGIGSGKQVSKSAAFRIESGFGSAHKSSTARHAYVKPVRTGTRRLDRFSQPLAVVTCTEEEF